MSAIKNVCLKAKDRVNPISKRAGIVVKLNVQFERNVISVTQCDDNVWWFNVLRNLNKTLKIISTISENGLIALNVLKVCITFWDSLKKKLELERESLNNITQR